MVWGEICLLHSSLEDADVDTRTSEGAEGLLSEYLKSHRGLGDNG